MTPDESWKPKPYIQRIWAALKDSHDGTAEEIVVAFLDPLASEVRAEYVQQVANSTLVMLEFNRAELAQAHEEIRNGNPILIVPSTRNTRPSIVQEFADEKTAMDWVEHTKRDLLAAGWIERGLDDEHDPD